MFFNFLRQGFAVLTLLSIISINFAMGQTTLQPSIEDNFSKRFLKLTTTSASLKIETGQTLFKTGDHVRINGAGFEKQEPVSISIETLPESKFLVGWPVIADDNGNLNFEWEVPYNGDFVIKAFGLNSKFAAETVIASSVTPVFVSGNPNCATLNASSNPAFAHITSNFGLKIDPPASGTVTFTNGSGRTLTGGAPADASNTVTTTLQSGSAFDWKSTKRISAVIVKGGPNANVYPYNPNSLGDLNLTTVGGSFGISHIEYCFENSATVTIIKDSQPNTPQAFKFKASGQVNDDFSLVDNGIVGPDRIVYTGLTGFGAGNSITVTEDPPGGFYSLTQINCTSSPGTNNNIISVPNRSVEIILEPGENVTCTFVNQVTTAANAEISGQIFNADGRGLGRVVVTVLNPNTQETRNVLTNPFGYYRVTDLPVGEFYIVTVKSKKHRFVPDTQAFTLLDAVEGLNFTAETD